jgi:GMP synthase-like glutamine amidotransferase
MIITVAPTVLFIRNEHLATEAMLGDAFAECGFDVRTFDVVPPERVDTPNVEVTFPSATDFDVIVPLGARWAVHDDSLRRGWVGAEQQLIRDAVAAGVATLGVCFGGQLIAQAFGGTVARAEVPELGWYEVTSDDQELIPGGRWFQWHFDRWTALPPGATELARTANSSQAFLLGRALALQFHPEVDGALLEGWLAADRDGDGDVKAFGLTDDEIRSETVRLLPDAAVRIRSLVRGFVDRMVRQPCPS